MLMPLAGNGGPTLSMMPMPGSSVINAGDNSPGGRFLSLSSTDQRGQPRIQNGFVDIGAVEVTWAATPFLREVRVIGASSASPARIDLTFSGPVTAAPGAFRLVRKNGSSVPIQARFATQNGYTVLSLLVRNLKAHRLGTYKLILDGTQLSDSASQPIPSLTQECILRV